MMMGRFGETAMRLLLSVALPVLLAAAPAMAGDADAGKALAQRWCGNCHMVEPSQVSASATGVPTFAGIARMPSTTEVSLRVFFQSPHQRMPDLHLSNGEMSDVIEYILSLKGT